MTWVDTTYGVLFVPAEFVFCHHRNFLCFHSSLHNCITFTNSYCQFIMSWKVINIFHIALANQMTLSTHHYLPLSTGIAKGCLAVATPDSLEEG